MFIGGTIRTEEVAVVVVVAGITLMAVENEEASREVDHTRMAGTNTVTRLQTIILGTIITIGEGEGAVAVVGTSTTTIIQGLKPAMPRQIRDLTIIIVHGLKRWQSYLWGFFLLVIGRVFLLSMQLGLLVGCR